MVSIHLILCHSLLFLPSVFSSIRVFFVVVVVVVVFFNELSLHIQEVELLEH